MDNNTMKTAIIQPVNIDAIIIKEILLPAADLDAKQQNEFFEMLAGTLSPDEITALKIGIGYIRLLKDKKYHDVMRKTMGEYFYHMYNEK